MVQPHEVSWPDSGLQVKLIQALQVCCQQRDQIFELFVQINVWLQPYS